MGKMGKIMAKEMMQVMIQMISHRREKAKMMMALMGTLIEVMEMKHPLTGRSKTTSKNNNKSMRHCA